MYFIFKSLFSWRMRTAAAITMKTTGPSLLSTWVRTFEIISIVVIFHDDDDDLWRWWSLMMIMMEMMMMISSRWLCPYSIGNIQLCATEGLLCENNLQITCCETLHNQILHTRNFWWTIAVSIITYYHIKKKL